jgi:hypothetical protein
MNPTVALVVYYVLLAAAVVVLRGDLTGWPREADRVLACGISLVAVVLLLRNWRTRHPLADAADDGSSRPRSTWRWWLGLAGLMAVVFMVVLPPVSRVLARPQSVQQAGDGGDATGPVPPRPAADGAATELDPSGLADPVPGAGGKTAADGAGELGMAGRFQELMRSRPPWILALFLALAAVTGALLWWMVRRTLWRRGTEPAVTGPRTSWHADPLAPAYVREFRRLCEHLGHAPRPGDTWRDLLGRLPASAGLPPLEPAAHYHYRVRYEGAVVDRAAEREYARVIRAARKAATFPPATETVTAE